jgi:hypothetical protein
VSETAKWAVIKDRNITVDDRSPPLTRGHRT